MPGPVALEDAKYRIDQAIADIERLRQEIQMAPSEHEQRLERSSPSTEVAVPLPAASSAGDTAQARNS